MKWENFIVEYPRESLIPEQEAAELSVKGAKSRLSYHDGERIRQILDGASVYSAMPVLDDPPLQAPDGVLKEGNELCVFTGEALLREHLRRITPEGMETDEAYWIHYFPYQDAKEMGKSLSLNVRIDPPGQDGGRSFLYDPGKDELRPESYDMPPFLMPDPASRELMDELDQLIGPGMTPAVRQTFLSLLKKGMEKNLMIPVFTAGLRGEKEKFQIIYASDGGKNYGLCFTRTAYAAAPVQTRFEDPRFKAPSCRLVPLSRILLEAAASGNCAGIHFNRGTGEKHLLLSRAELIQITGIVKAPARAPAGGKFKGNPNPIPVKKRRR